MTRLLKLLTLTLAMIACLAGSAMAELTSTPRVQLETSKGNIVIKLNGQKAPISTLNFIDYATAGYYNDTTFHRIIPDFMIQGGGYNKDYSEKKEGLRPGIKNEWKNGLKNAKYTISMARVGGDVNSATAQFFINTVDNPSLDRPQPDGGAYAVFGDVVEGQDVVEAIRGVKTSTNAALPGYGDAVPVEPVMINKVTILDEFDRASVEAVVKASEQAEETAKKEAEMAEVKKLEDVIAKIEAEKGKKFQTTASGLMILIEKEGEGKNPAPTDKVEVHYRGTFLDGNEFDSSYKRGQPATFGLNQVIKGWTEGVGMIKPTGKAVLICPPDLAYGKGGRPGAIPPSSTLVFEVELLSIK